MFKFDLNEETFQGDYYLLEDMDFSSEGNTTNCRASKTWALHKILPSLPRSQITFPSDLKTIFLIVNWKKQPHKLKEIDPVNGKKRRSYFLSFYFFAALLNEGEDAKSGGVFGCRRQ